MNWILFWEIGRGLRGLRMLGWVCVDISICIEFERFFFMEIYLGDIILECGRNLFFCVREIYICIFISKIVD